MQKGGSFTSGSGYDYNGIPLVVADNVIVVTINYRLGPLGYAVIHSEFVMFSALWQWKNC